jgi:hypothetical protein
MFYDIYPTWDNLGIERSNYEYEDVILPIQNMIILHVCFTNLTKLEICD